MVFFYGWKTEFGSKDSSLFTILYSLFSIHSSLLTIHSSLFTIHYSLFTLHYSLFIKNSSRQEGESFPKVTARSISF